MAVCPLNLENWVESAPYPLLSIGLEEVSFWADKRLPVRIKMAKSKFFMLLFLFVCKW
jgi:hypothetical protein